MTDSNITYEIDIRNNLIVARAVVDLKFEDFVLHMNELLNDENFYSGINGLYDFTLVSRITGDVTHWERTSNLITENKRITENAKVAIIIGNNKQLNSLFNGWKTMMEFTLIEYQTFKTFEGATNWLKLGS